jgi:hypothetical protein
VWVDDAPPEPFVPSTDPSVRDLERVIEDLERGSTRVSRETRGTTANTFDFPESGKRPGWDYCWWPFKIVGEEVDASTMVEIRQGGWVEVPRSHFPTLLPPGWKKPCIERQGMRAYMRPMRLSLEAKNEAYQQAWEQRESRMRQQQTGDIGREFAQRDPRAGGVDVKIQPLV